ncbi:sterile alpha motif domain-containing protein 9-like [Clinocottus analis]|uniref:sterile alpha motif domain-containing protein 9-like n=1 Tax=Clinocottus analis TaxID=304258 RepID=UPI0035C1AEBF
MKLIPKIRATLDMLHLEYVQQNPKSTNTQLFSFLALLNTYVPESYLLMSECQRILGPPDPIHGVYKNRLIREATHLNDIIQTANKAFEAFKDVERKADREEGPEMKDMTGTVNISNSFNNRGLFGFIQVAKIAFEKLQNVRSPNSQDHIQELKIEVQAKFDFFERYLTYSKPSMTSVERDYFWMDVSLCYEMYTTETAAKSMSFPGLLDGLNHGLFTSKGRRAGFEEAKKTVSDLEKIRDELKTAYEADLDDVQAAECYILSNVILSNKMHNSPELTPVNELQAIIRSFLNRNIGRHSPEFYLMALMLFWPEEEPQMVQDDDDEEEQPATGDELSEDETWEVEDNDEEQETSGEPVQLSLDLMFDLQKYVTFMERSFERSDAKYLRGRYLSPLFFLGKGSGLSRWIHKSKLDEIVGNEVDRELDGEKNTSMSEKWKRINGKWTNGDVWRIPEVEDMLLPVRVKPHSTYTMLLLLEEQVLVCAGGRKIMVTKEVEPDLTPSPMLYYLGFNIKGPVVF